jgi:anti-anti-sigma factor
MNATDKFSTTSYPSERSIKVALNEDFQHGDWDAIGTLLTQRLQRDIVFWDLDLRRLGFMNSQMLGLIVGMNSEIKMRGGQLRLVVREGSPIDQLLTLSKVRRIITVVNA